MNRQLFWDYPAWQEYLHWQSTDKKTLKKINAIIEDTLRNPYTGIGKPEPLKGNLGGLWSRRINDKDRLVYAVYPYGIGVASCRGHYNDK